MFDYRNVSKTFQDYKGHTWPSGPGDGNGLLALTNGASALGDADAAPASEPPRQKSPSPVRGPSNALQPWLVGREKGLVFQFMACVQKGLKKVSLTKPLGFGSHFILDKSMYCCNF